MQKFSHPVDQGFSNARVIAEVSHFPDKVCFSSGRRAVAMATRVIDHQKPGKSIRLVTRRPWGLCSEAVETLARIHFNEVSYANDSREVGLDDGREELLAAANATVNPGTSLTNGNIESTAQTATQAPSIVDVCNNMPNGSSQNTDTG